MEVVTVSKDKKVNLSGRLAEWLGDQKELVAFVEGDTLIIKRIKGGSPSATTESAGRTEMSLIEISQEVHKYRKAKKRKI